MSARRLGGQRARAGGRWLVERLEAGGALAGYYLLPATRADLLRRSGRAADAAAAYQEALDLAPTEVERRYLARRMAESGGPAGRFPSRQHPTDSASSP
jgi:RNA polymerase sigma-70 factor (ECF subfamily)